MSRTITRMGIDVGGVFVKIVVLDAQGRVMSRVARRHRGSPVSVVREEFRKLCMNGPVAIGVTGSYAHLVAGGLNLIPVDFVNAEIRAVRRVFPDARNIINVGGSSVTLVQLDEHGRFMDYNTNSLCAAGTGSFLDQQADRLGIRYDDLETLAHHDSPPPIATRCSVFAKTDLIHRQQEGYDKSALWCGLCKSMTRTFLNTLLRGRPLRGLTVLTGGVSQNREVLRWLKARYGDLVQTFEDASFSGAVGAAHMTNGKVDDLRAAVASLRDTGERAEDAARRPRLAFHKSVYPSFDVAEAYTDDLGNEIRVTNWPVGRPVAVYLGIDVGSTSTKVLLMDDREKVVADIYRSTGGDPIEATRRLFSAVRSLAERRRSEVAVLGVGTTGSGRKLVAHVVGADMVVNEITAHLTGTMHVDPRVDTIFEIGGQDAKYIHAKGGRIVDSNMNYVCAAGTGSFVAEQADRLGFRLEEIGDIVMGLAPPVTSDRCTVFMAQDVERLIRCGHTREECIAAVLCSVVKNYLNKVVGHRHVSRERIFFQGATARNKGLVAAFENLLDVEMVVSPYCHVMGSYGAALLVKRQMTSAGARSRFRGLDLAGRKIVLHTETCDLCANHCTLTFAEIEGETARPSWGYMCGRDPEETRARVRSEFRPFRRRLRMLFEGGETASIAAARTIGIPRSLITYSLYPLWRRFFGELGFKVVLSGRTDEDIVRRGNELTAADFCFPIKVAHGHAARLAEDKDVDFIFLPHLICLDTNPKTTNSYFCPLLQAFPSVIRSALTLHGVDASRLLTPVVDFSHQSRTGLDELARGLAGPLGLRKADIRRAWRAARADQRRFEQRRCAEGRKTLRELADAGRPALVIMGRPYNTLDFGANLGLPQKIADLGLPVIPMDMLPYDIERIHPAFRNMYWAYGQHILSAAEFIRHRKNLYGIYFSNFSCGPDSFLLSLVEEVMGDKPFLTLELDEHGGDAGYLTRVEAFLDVVRAWPGCRQPPFTVSEPEPLRKELRRKTIWIPRMHPVGGPLYAAAFRGAGCPAKSFPPDTRETFELGRSITRGSECMPAACTIGTFVDLLRRRGIDPAEQVLFMPGADGPCRFGQYQLLQRLVLNRLGYGDTAILSPSCRNTYQGLPAGLQRRFWEAIVCADFLWKAACKVRPYETEPGRTDSVLQEEVARLVGLLESRQSVYRAFADAVARVAAVPMHAQGSRTLVGVVGEIFVRCNVFCNDELIRSIERQGGEAWPAPISEWVLYTAAFQRWRAAKRLRSLPEFVGACIKNRLLRDVEHRFRKAASPFLDDRAEPPIDDVIRDGAHFLPVNFSGEAIITLGRAVQFAGQGVDLVVNVAPFGCMPGTITAGLCREVQARTGIPMVSLFYDGEAGANRRLEVFLAALTGYNGTHAGGFMEARSGMRAAACSFTAAPTA